MEGDNTPAYDGNGFVTDPDRTGTMINDMKAFLDYAQTKNIVVIFALWNGAYLNNQNTINLMWDESKLQTYIDKALKVIILYFDFTITQMNNLDNFIIYLNINKIHKCINKISQWYRLSAITRL